MCEKYWRGEKGLSNNVYSFFRYGMVNVGSGLSSQRDHSFERVFKENGLDRLESI